MMTLRTKMSCATRCPDKQTSTAIVGNYDILCGRTKDILHNTGNRRFREIVSSWVPKYVATPKRMEKTLVIHDLAEAILADGGRFWKQEHSKEPSSGELVFVPLDKKQIRTKVGHALRDMIAWQAKKKTSWKQRAATNNLLLRPIENATTTATTTTTRRKMSLGCNNVLDQQEHQEQPSLCQQKLQPDPPLDSESSTGTVSEEDEEVHHSCDDEQVSVVTLDIFDNIDEEQEHWWSNSPSVTLGDSSSSSFCDDDDSMPHTPTPAIADHRLLQQTSVGLLNEEDFLETDILASVSEDPPLAEIVFDM